MDSDQSEHLTENQIVAFLSHELEGSARRNVELHLARCAECRDEIVSVTEILRPRRNRHGIPWRVLAPAAAAAAAIMLLVAGPLSRRGPEDVIQHRDAQTQVSTVPTPVSPTGLVSDVEHLVWHLVDGADRYRLTLFDAAGVVLWKTATTDTVAALPDSVLLNPGASYLWRLEARVGWDLWDASDLIDFQIEGEAP
jgi:hypothetical protein